jgi:hypothetical protein
MSSVCVSGCLASTGGSFFALAPFAPFGGFSSLVVRSEGVSYLTSECNGGPGIAQMACKCANWVRAGRGGTTTTGEAAEKREGPTLVLQQFCGSDGILGCGITF